MAKVFLAVKDIGNGRVRPKVRIMVSVIPRHHAFFLLPVHRRDQDPLGSQRLRDGADRLAIRSHSEDTLYDLGGLRIDQQRLVFRIHLIAIRNRTAHSLAVFHAVAEDGLDLLAGIPRVPLVHDIQERRELVFSRIIAVDVIIDGNESDTLVREKDLGIETDLKVVPSDSRHILDAYCRHVPRLDFIQQSLKARAIEIRAGVSVIREMTDILESLG